MAVVGVTRWVFHLPGCRSLKMKRSVIRSLRDRIIAKFKISAAETGLQDNPSMAELTACVVSGNRRQVESIMGHVDTLVRAEPRAHIMECETEIF